jgi:catechol 2,3-dioxygenase-like lactoylglutathione lyase family enzyme
MSIPAHLNIVTIGVADLPRSVAFYQALGWRRSSASMDEISWFDVGGCALGLFPRDELAADAGVPDGPGGFGGITLAINLASESEVDAALADAERAGGTIVKPAQRAEWGGYSGYFADPDGTCWEVAMNPGFTLRDDGSLVLP